MVARTVTISGKVSRRAKAAIDRRMAEGKFKDAGAVIEHLVSLDEDNRKLAEMLKVGLKGPFQVADAAFWRKLEQDADRKIAVDRSARKAKA